MVKSATVRLWGNNLGALYLDEQNNLITFQYYDEFGNTGFNVSPILYLLKRAESSQNVFPEVKTIPSEGFPNS